MGRRRVEPENRVRAVRACQQCKFSKKRCDSSLPCSNCERRGLSESCSYVNIAADRRNDEVIRDAASTGVNLQTSGQPVRQNTRVDSVFDVSGTSQRGHEQNNSSIESRTELLSTGPSTSTRLVKNSHGQKVFIGPSGSLSFLHLVREAVAKSIGSSDFSNDAERQQMLEVDQHQSTEIEERHYIEYERKLRYAQSFLVATAGIMSFLSHEDVLSVIQNQSPRVYHQNASYGSCTAALIIAIGAQCYQDEMFRAHHEREAFSWAQKLAFSEMLEHPSIDLIQNFLLLAFYMLGACKRNAAFMYLGIAARAAFALGLHSPDCHKLVSRKSSQLGMNLWKSLVNLDLITGSILGRAIATSVAKTGNLSVTGEQTPPRVEVLAMQSSFELSLIIDQIVTNLYGSQESNARSAEQYLDMLNSWSASLPAELKYSRLQSTSDKDASARVVASLHISCYYYFAVMLVTRPFLISNLVGTLDTGQKQPARQVPEHETTQLSRSAEMAETCLDAALKLSRACSRADEAGYLAQSMCLLEAWIFAAGLVLGFRMFATQEGDLEINESYIASQNILRKFSNRSPQALHYLGILRHFAQAISKQQRLRRAKRPSRIGSTIDTILNFDTDTDNHQPIPSPIGYTIGSSRPAVEVPSPNTMDMTDADLLFDFDSAAGGWDNSALQFWDKFPFNAQDSDQTNLQWTFTSFTDPV